MKNQFIAPFVPYTEPTEVEFFSIYTRDGVRYIHLWGYTYESDGNDDFITEENPYGAYWANMEACGLEIPLDEFLEEYNARGEDGNDYVNELYEEAKQYQGDYDDAGIVDVINHYYGMIVFPASNPEGHPDGFLHYSEVDMETPDGDYLFEC